MNTRKTYLTDVGIQKLTDELTELTEKQRPELAKRLRDAIKTVSYTHLTLPTTPYV